MKFLLTKSKHGIELPLNMQLSMDAHAVTVLGLAKQEEQDGLICQWWITEENEAKSTAGTVGAYKEGNS